MAKHKAHKKFGKMELEKQEANRKRVLESYNGKTALLQTYEQMKIEDDYTAKLRVDVRNLRTRLNAMGAL